MSISHCKLVRVCYNLWRRKNLSEWPFRQTPYGYGGTQFSPVVSHRDQHRRAHIHIDSVCDDNDASSHKLWSTGSFYSCPGVWNPNVAIIPLALLRAWERWNSTHMLWSIIHSVYEHEHKKQSLFHTHDGSFVSPFFRTVNGFMKHCAKEVYYVMYHMSMHLIRVLLKLAYIAHHLHTQYNSSAYVKVFDILRPDLWLQYSYNTSANIQSSAEASCADVNWPGNKSRWE